MSKRVEGKGFFETASVEDFPTVQPITLDTDTSIVDAFSKLCTAGIHSAPVWDKKEKKYIGFFAVADMVVYVIESLRATSGPDVEVPSTFSDVKELVAWVHRHDSHAVGTVANLSKKNPYKSLNPGASLLKALEMLGTKGLKRMPVVDVQTGKIIKLISQTNLNRYLIENQQSYEFFGETRVKDCPHFLRDVVAVPINAPALRAFELMMKHDISAVAVVTAAPRSKKVVGSISDTDMKLIIQKKNFSLYGITVEDLLKLLRPKEPNAVVTVKPSSKLVEIPNILQDKKIHRVYIVNDDDCLSGVITFKELMSELLKKVKVVVTDW